MNSPSQNIRARLAATSHPGCPVNIIGMHINDAGAKNAQTAILCAGVLPPL